MLPKPPFPATANATLERSARSAPSASTPRRLSQPVKGAWSSPAMGCAQIDQLPTIIAERQRIKAAYEKDLSQIPGIVMQTFREPVEPVLWTMAVRLLPQNETVAELRARRDRVMATMLRGGIETRPGFYALNLPVSYTHLRAHETDS